MIVFPTLKFEIESQVAQWDGYLDNLVITQKNLTKNYFEFKAGWSPNFKVGKTITARTPQNVLIYGIITRVEAEHFRSLTATIRIRQYIPNLTTWFKLSSSPLNNPNFPLI